MAIENRYFPHLLQNEIDIWKRWLTIHEADFDRYDYDVRVGESIVPPPMVDANIADMAVSLAKKRIDVVAWKGDWPTIIEIKTYAGLTAVGQMVSYPLLFGLENPDYEAADILLITARMMPDIATILNFYEIPFIIV